MADNKSEKSHTKEQDVNQAKIVDIKVENPHLEEQQIQSANMVDVTDEHLRRKSIEIQQRTSVKAGVDEEHPHKNQEVHHALMNDLIDEFSHHTDIHEIEEDYEEVDDSRPFFQRQPCEVGIYLSVYEAIPKDQKSVGLDHFFRMKTTDVLYEAFSKRDIVTIRAAFVHDKKLKDAYIERFEPGIVMAVGFDTVEALEDLWTLHKKEELNSLMTKVLLTPDVLKATAVSSLTMETKLWDDEYESCKEELETRSSAIQDIQYRVSDLNMVKRLKAYQQTIAKEVFVMRDLDNEMELNRSEFMNCIRNLLPKETEEIASLAQYEKLAKSPKARKMFYKDLLDLYSSIIEKWRASYKIFEVEISMPFLQIHDICENSKQKDIKNRVLKSISDMLNMLRPESDLHKVCHPEMANKIIKREAKVFLGLLSLVPLGVEKISEIDILIDEYAREFKVDFK